MTGVGDALRNRLISVVRTYVLLGVGSVVTWLAVHFGVVISAQTRDAVVVFVVALVSAVYYAAVRLLEHYVPKAGLLLGYPAAPKYVDVLVDGTAVITSLQDTTVRVGTGPDPLDIDGQDANTPGSSAPTATPEMSAPAATSTPA